MDWYPRSPMDFFKRTLGWSLAERGAYSCLIDAYYMFGEPLPDDDASLAALLGVQIEEWLPLSVRVRSKFQVIDGFLRHERCDSELEIQAEKGTKKAASSRENGKLGGRPKLLKTKRNKPTKTYAKPNDNPEEPTIHNNTIDAEAKASSEAAAPPTEDLKTIIFGTALDWLSTKSGKSKDRFRSLAGKWCSQHGDARTLEAMQVAARNAPLDPVPYIEKYLKEGGTQYGTKPNGAAARPTASSNALAAAAAILGRGQWTQGDDAGRQDFSAEMAGPIIDHG